MTNTIRNLSLHDLAERIGGMAGTLDADNFRALAIKAGYGDSRCTDIPDAVWYKLVQEMAASTKSRFVYATDSESGTIEANSLEEAFAALRAGITDKMIADGATLWVEDGSGQRITMQEVAS
jgi:hypothetical protein